MIHLNAKERATILAALRLWQLELKVPGAIPTDLCMVATDNFTIKPMESKEIDALCQRINCA